MSARLAFLLVLAVAAWVSPARVWATDLPSDWPRLWREFVEARNCDATLALLERIETSAAHKAHYLRASLLEQGVCLDRDLGKAIGHYRIAAEERPEAAIRLWAIYEFGVVGDASDPERADHWAAMAARRLIQYDELLARTMAKKVAAPYPVTGSLKSQIDSVFDIARKGGDAVLDRALLLRAGDSPPDDPFAACLWLEAAQRSGNGMAGLELARMLLEGSHVQRNPQQAAWALKTAMMAGIADAFVLAAQLNEGDPRFRSDRTEAYLAYLLAKRAGAGVDAHISALRSELPRPIEETLAEVAVNGERLPLVTPKRAQSQPSCRALRDNSDISPR